MFTNTTLLPYPQIFHLICMGALVLFSFNHFVFASTGTVRSLVKISNATAVSNINLHLHKHRLLPSNAKVNNKSPILFHILYLTFTKGLLVKFSFTRWTKTKPPRKYPQRMLLFSYCSPLASNAADKSFFHLTFIIQLRYVW